MSQLYEMSVGIMGHYAVRDQKWKTYDVLETGSLLTFEQKKDQLDKAGLYYSLKCVVISDKKGFM